MHYMGRDQGLFQQIWEKATGQNWDKKIDLTSKFGEINDIEHYKGSKIYPQNQVILDCIMLSIPFKHKCLSIFLIWASVSHLVVVVSKKKVKEFFFFFFTFLNWENQTWYWDKGGYFWLGMGRNSAPRDGQKRPWGQGVWIPLKNHKKI